MGLLGFTLIAWVATARLMGGMDAGPGTPLGGFWWFLGSWILMMAAMMLPAEMRFTLVFAQFARDEAGAGRSLAHRIGAFLAGYFLLWSVYGAMAWTADRLLRAQAPAAFGWDAQGPLVAGAVIGLAGLYQISPWKQACLLHCVSPLGFFMRHWRPGPSGALRMGLRHGLYCIGCCWALMLVLFAVGVMSLYWMCLLTLVMFAEKIMPRGAVLSWPLALALMLLGLWVALNPSSVPFLVAPGTPVLHSH